MVKLIIWTADRLAQLSPLYRLDDIVEDFEGYNPTIRLERAATVVDYAWNSFYVAELYNRIFWGLVCGFVLVATIRRFAGEWMNQRSPLSVQRAQTFITKHFFLSSTVGRKALEPISVIGGFMARWTTVQIPTRIHGLVVFAYVFVNVFLMLYYTNPPIDAYFFPLGWPLNKIMRNMGDRTAIMSFGQTPLVMLLAMRTNPISILTGASYSTLQIYHRWSARMVFMQALAHSLAWIILEADYSSVVRLSIKMYFREEPYWIYGFVATVAGFMLCIASWRRLRELSYELFLIIHILSIIMWTVGCYYHVILLGEYYAPYMRYIYAAIAFWAADRVARWVRQAFLNIPRFWRKEQAPGPLAAEGYLVGSGNLVRLRVSPPATWSHLMGGPGAYVFISSPGLRMYEAHPFTIAWPAGMPGLAHLHAESPGEEEGKQLSSKRMDFEEYTNPETSFELLLKAYGGYTRRLAKELAIDAEGGTPKRVKIWIDGPYGHAATANAFESVMLVTGGTGVAAAIAQLAHLAKCAAKDTLLTRRVILVWTVRNPADLEALSPYLHRLQALLPAVNSAFLTIYLHRTYGSKDTADVEKAIEHTNSNTSGHSVGPFAGLEGFCNITYVDGRPEVSPYLELLMPYVEGRIAVNACGPSGLCDRTREVVKARLGANVSSHQLVYNEEAFTW